MVKENGDSKQLYNIYRFDCLESPFAKVLKKMEILNNSITIIDLTRHISYLFSIV